MLLGVSGLTQAREGGDDVHRSAYGAAVPVSGQGGGPIDTPDLDPYERLQPDTQAAVAAALREQYEGGKSIRDLAADTGYSIARVRTLLECADAALRPRGAAQAADQH